MSSTPNPPKESLNPERNDVSTKSNVTGWSRGAQLESLFIGISGLIGAGKTTLCKSLAERLGCPAYYEGVIDNVYLADFYADQAKYSFQLQVFLLNRRFKQHQQIVWGGQGGVQDRTIYEDSVFAKTLRDAGLMEERDYQTYIELFHNMANFMRKPNLIVHLDVTPEESMERIKKRSRSCESSIPLDYLQKLYVAYDEFINDISKVIPVIKVNWNTFQSTEEMARVIEEEWKKMSNIHHVDWPNSGGPGSPSQMVIATGSSPPSSPPSVSSSEPVAEPKAEVAV